MNRSQTGDEWGGGRGPSGQRNQRDKGCQRGQLDLGTDRSGDD